MRASNENHAHGASRNRYSPLIELHRVGDGRSLARALATVIVRRELIFASLIAEPTDCENPRAAG
jgi:hypothetical protein